MLGTIKGRLLIIALAILASAGFLYRNYRECAARPPEARGTCSPIKLGLDLQGGMHLALEVRDPEGTLTPEAKRDATDRALRVIRTRIDEFGVAEPLVQKVGDDRIIVELPGIRDEERARQVIERTAFLELRLVTGGRQVREALPRIDRAIVAALRSRDGDGASDAMRHHLENVERAGRKS